MLRKFLKTNFLKILFAVNMNLCRLYNFKLIFNLILEFA